MLAVIETPRWSFTKYRVVDGRPVAEFRSPLPNIFNYGYIEGTRAPDGMEEDAIVLGPTLKAGARVDAKGAGVVLFRDAGVTDDKRVLSADGRIGFADWLAINAFFIAYSAFKTVRRLIIERRLGACVFGGVVRNI